MSGMTKIHVDENLYNSKTLAMLMLERNKNIKPEEILNTLFSKVVDEIISGCKFNQADLWLYTAALEIISNALKSGMPDREIELYKDTLKNLNIITFVDEKGNRDEQ